LKTKRLSANREVGYTYSIVSKIEYLLWKKLVKYMYRSYKFTKKYWNLSRSSIYWRISMLLIRKNWQIQVIRLSDKF
jgi:hypothetical protein